MFNITHIDKFFHNSPSAARYLGTPHFVQIKDCYKTRHFVTAPNQSAYCHSNILPMPSAQYFVSLH